MWCAEIPSSAAGSAVTRRTRRRPRPRRWPKYRQPRRQPIRATKLEADAQKQRDKLAELGPLVVVNVQGSAIAKLFRLPDEEADFAATAQQFGVAVVVELIIVMCMIAWEVLGHALPTAARPEDVASNAAVASLEVAPPATLALPPRPKLVAANNEPLAGSIPKIMTAALEPAAGKRVELRRGVWRLCWCVPGRGQARRASGPIRRSTQEVLQGGRHTHQGRRGPSIPDECAACRQLSTVELRCCQSRWPPGCAAPVACTR